MESVHLTPQRQPLEASAEDPMPAAPYTPPPPPAARVAFDQSSTPPPMMSPMGGSSAVSELGRTTKFPRMMDPNAPEAEEAGSSSLPETEADEAAIIFPSFLRLEEIRTSDDASMRASKFDASLEPLAQLSAADVVCGCAARGKRLVGESRVDMAQFVSHVRAVDRRAPFSSLDVDELVHAPMACTKAAMGAMFYLAAVSARFGPSTLNVLNKKVQEYKVVERVKAKAGNFSRNTADGLRRGAEGVQTAWHWLKSKVLKKQEKEDNPPKDYHNIAEDVA